VTALTVERFFWDDAVRRAAAEQLRMDVFVAEQGVPADEEIDDIDPVALHVLVRDAATGVALGTGRVFDPDGSGRIARIGRMAVARTARRRGVGRRVLIALMREGLARGVAEMVLDAQTHAIPFYASLGFEVTGPEHLDCGIPHRMMGIAAAAARRRLAAEPD
jgi:predicted GNAT family N-acyltransferase